MYEKPRHLFIQKLHFSFKVFRSENTLLKIFRHVAFILSCLSKYFILQFLIKTIFTIIIKP